MTVCIHHLETMVPGRAYPQNYASEKMQEWTDDARQKRLVKALYQKSGIEQRYSVVASFDEGKEGDFFPLDEHGQRREPGTARRNDIFTREVHPLAVELARKTIAPSWIASAISCIFSLPGDCLVIIE